MAAVAEHPHTVTVEYCIKELGMSGLGWLAGYPRSGAALIRIILAHCFGHRTASNYTEDYIGEDYAQAVNLLTFPQEIPTLWRVAQEQHILTIKTHERLSAPESAPCIIIVRDGRRVLESLQAFYRERNDVVVSMEQMIEGDHIWRSWSEWIRNWAQFAPANALWLRYEDIMIDQRAAVGRIAAWLGLQPHSYEIPSFEELHARTPSIFRKAEIEGNGGMTDTQESAFWQLHGGAMSMLGYYR